MIQGHWGLQRALELMIWRSLLNIGAEGIIRVSLPILNSQQTKECEVLRRGVKSKDCFVKHERPEKEKLRKACWNDCKSYLGVNSYRAAVLQKSAGPDKHSSSCLETGSP